jgi:hypothetical protein
MSEIDPKPDSNEMLFEILGGMYITMLRLYDVLCLLAQDNPKINELISLHESGRVLSPDPALILDENE